MEINNRKAKHNYFILEEIECGIVLVGTEIKAIRQGSANFNDAFCKIRNHEVFVYNMHISHYEHGNIFNHDERRERKLLLRRSEINKLEKRLKLENLTLVPLKLCFVSGRAKVLIGLAKGKKNYDKRNDLKEKDMQRASQKALKDSYR